jgi:hypothetical protein
MVIASADSKIRVSEGGGITQKFEGQISRQPLTVAPIFSPYFGSFLKKSRNKSSQNLFSRSSHF